MAIELPALPYERDALAPHISGETIDFHYGKHHRSYVDKLNAMIEGTELAEASLEEIIAGAEDSLFDNAAQIWNHTFYWRSMSPSGGGEPTGEVAEVLNRTFGSYDKFREEFTTAAKSQFGSGWAWLADTGDGIEIMKTANADLPLAHSAKALLTIDVWEHAYYIDFRNDRPSYIDTFLDHLVNWDHVAASLV